MSFFSLPAWLGGKPANNVLPTNSRKAGVELGGVTVTNAARKQANATGPVSTGATATAPRLPGNSSQPAVGGRRSRKAKSKPKSKAKSKAKKSKAKKSRRN